MIRYDILKYSATLFLTFTGLTPSEFEILSVSFKEALKNSVVRESVERKDRKRKYGGGRKPKLRKDEDKLLFILVYFKLYPLQAVIGYFFGMSQSQASEWIYRLSDVLKTALEISDCLPERNPENLRRVLLKDGADEVAIDGAERRIQRPKDPEKQKKCYSGKKRMHSVKNDTVVTVRGRKAIYLSRTCEGKKHDKKICDEENPTFPEGIVLYKDTGFQGYEPEGVIAQQPKKKPRGGQLSRAEKNQNRIISGVRIVAEHVISGIKRSRIVKDIFRNTKEKYDDLVMEIACGLHNFRNEMRSA
ncbi:MAG: transposase [Okeania sp. SIO3B3]|nr:transposase [Okeania sp. SIO3B3]